jgi:hypothetical protein
MEQRGGCQRRRRPHLRRCELQPAMLQSGKTAAHCRHSHDRTGGSG